MSQTNDDPQVMTLRVLPTDFEIGRAQLEAAGYTMTQCTTHTGYLELVGERSHCTCDLCREDAQ